MWEFLLESFPPQISASLHKQPLASLFDSDVHTHTHTAWDDYGHDTHMPYGAETKYANGLNLC